MVCKAGCECRKTREVLRAPGTPTFRDQGSKEEPAEIEEVNKQLERKSEDHEIPESRREFFKHERVIYMEESLDLAAWQSPVALTGTVLLV